jgi:hypothetical protein
LISNVTLDGEILQNWQIYLTKNIIPNFQFPAPPPPPERLGRHHNHQGGFIRNLLKNRKNNKLHLGE